jgi:hypothetical protein
MTACVPLEFEDEEKLDASSWHSFRSCKSERTFKLPVVLVSETLTKQRNGVNQDDERSRRSQRASNIMSPMK